MKIFALLVAVVASLCAQAPPQAGIPPETVVAKVDGKDVTAGEVRKILETTPGFARPYQQNPALALEELFVTRHLAAEGEKQKLAEASPWKEQLEALRANLLTNAMINKERDTYPVPAEMMEDYYKRNQARYEQAKIKVIFIGFRATPPVGTSPEALKEAARLAVEAARNPNQRSEADAKALAADLVKKIRDGADFAKLVAENSEDATSKAAGGDFGVIKPGSSYPEDIKKAVFALKQGEVSEPVRQPTGYYVIRSEERTAQPIDAVRESIIQDIRQAHLNDFINGLRQRFAPKIEKPEFFQQAPGKQ